MVLTLLYNQIEEIEEIEEICPNNLLTLNICVFITLTVLVMQ